MDVQTEDATANVLGLLPPHEQMLDLATYGPVLIAKEECERNYAGEVVVLDDKEVDAQVVVDVTSEVNVKVEVELEICSET